eukprot:2726169-Alexandrium_andersonii.AAC.1
MERCSKDGLPRRSAATTARTAPPSLPTALRLCSRPVRVSRHRPWQRRAPAMRRRPPPSSVT